MGEKIEKFSDIFSDENVPAHTPLLFRACVAVLLYEAFIDSRLFSGPKDVDSYNNSCNGFPYKIPNGHTPSGGPEHCSDKRYWCICYNAFVPNNLTDKDTNKDNFTNKWVKIMCLEADRSVYPDIVKKQLENRKYDCLKDRSSPIMASTQATKGYNHRLGFLFSR